MAGSGGSREAQRGHLADGCRTMELQRPGAALSIRSIGKI